MVLWELCPSPLICLTRKFSWASPQPLGHLFRSLALLGPPRPCTRAEALLSSLGDAERWLGRLAVAVFGSPGQPSSCPAAVRTGCWVSQEAQGTHSPPSSLGLTPTYLPSFSPLPLPPGSCPTNQCHSALSQGSAFSLEHHRDLHFHFYGHVYWLNACLSTEGSSGESPPPRNRRPGNACRREKL